MLFDSQGAVIFVLAWRFFSPLFLFGVVWFHNRVPLGPNVPGIVLQYDVLL